MSDRIAASWAEFALSFCAAGSCATVFGVEEMNWEAPRRLNLPDQVCMPRVMIGRVGILQAVIQLYPPSQ